MIRSVTKADAIRALSPNAQFAVIGDTEIIWHTPDIPQPSEAEIAAKIAELTIKAEMDRYSDAVQAHIDATARSRSYRDGFALAGYVNSAVPPWRAEAEAFVAWRDEVWLFVFDKLAQIQAGTVEPPSSPVALIGWLPPIEWP